MTRFAIAYTSLSACSKDTDEASSGPFNPTLQFYLVSRIMPASGVMQSALTHV